LEAVSREQRSTGATHIIGHGWDESRWQDTTLPTADQLDRASAGARVYLTRADAHSALVSRALITSVPYCRTLVGFDDSGCVTQEAHHALRSAALGQIDERTRRRAQIAFLDAAARCGIVSVHEMSGPIISSEQDCVELLALAREREGTRVVAYWGELAQSGGIETARRVGARGAGGDLFVDGSLGSHTACLHEPYADASDTSGREFIDAETIAQHVEACVLQDVQTGFHAIGDAATEAVISAFIRAGERYGADRVRAQGHRIEHAEAMSPSAITACGEWGIVASMQPVFDARWGGAEGMYARRLGAARAEGLNAIADLQAAGAMVAFGSDAPVTPLDPWGAIHAAVNHHVPTQRISATSAIDAHARCGWLAAGDRAVGEVAVGQPAHIAAWSRREGNPLPEPGSQALLTLVEGHVIWNAGVLETVTS
jgi:predicted amidohydrolase YtcJ